MIKRPFLVFVEILKGIAFLGIVGAWIIVCIKAVTGT